MAAQRKVRKEASQATVRAGTELDNKQRCIGKERFEQAKQTNASSLTTAKAPPAKATMHQSSLRDSETTFVLSRIYILGCYPMEVLAGYSPSMNLGLK